MAILRFGGYLVDGFSKPADKLISGDDFMLHRILLGLALWAASIGITWGQSPYPAFTGKSVRVSETLDVYDAVREEIAKIETNSPQHYYVVVVKNAGSGSNATPNYADNLYARWRDEAPRKGLTLDTARSVLIVLALENRGLAVVPGAELQSRYGFMGQMIDQQLVQPHFVPYARAQDYAGGLVKLIQEIDNWLAAREQSIQTQNAQAVARLAETKKNAQATAETAKALLASVQLELASKKAEGFTVDSYTSAVDKSSALLTELNPLLQSKPEQALQLALEAQRQLQQTGDELKQLAALQTQAQTKLQEVSQQQQKLEESMKAQRLAGFALGQFPGRAGGVLQELEKTRSLVKSNPRQALADLEKISKQITELQEYVEKTPQFQAQWKKQLADLQQQHQEVQAKLKAAQASGPALAEQQQALQNIEQKLQQFSQTTDYNGAMTGMNGLGTQLATQRASIESARSAYQFTHRTLPFSLLAIFLVALSAVGGWITWRFKQLKQKATAEFEKLQADLVKLLEDLDALKHRHQYLPYTDQDFKEPMVGDTLALYQEVNQRLDSLRQQWLAAMDVQTQAEGQLSLVKFPRTAALVEVRTLIAQAPGLPDAPKVPKHCSDSLDRLENAHETAQEQLQTCEKLCETLRDQLTQLADASLDTAPYDPPLQHGLARLEEARQHLTPDPIGTQHFLADTHTELKKLHEWTTQVIKLREETLAVEAELNKAQQAVAEQRESGLKLEEEGGNPNSALARGRKELASALSALQRGQVDVSKQHLQKVQQAAQEAHELIALVLSTRKDCETNLPLRQAEATRLHEAVPPAEEAQRELQQSFARESWLDLAENLPQVRHLLQQMDDTLHAAESCVQPEVQQYLQAAEVLHRLEQVQLQTHHGIAALALRLKELRELRQRSQNRKSEIEEQRGKVEEYYQRHAKVIRSVTRPSLKSALATLEQSQKSQQNAQPHWPGIWEQLQAAAQAFKVAQDQAEQDVRSHEELQKQLDAAQRHMRQVGDLLRNNSADRPRANQQYRNSQTTIEQLARDVTAADADWPRLLSKLQQAQQDLTLAEQWAKADIQLAAQAADALASAQRQLQQASSYYSLGISPNVGGLDTQLSSAKRLLSTQAYEQVIEHARTVETSARAAYDDAVRQVERKQREMDAARRQREAALAAAAIAATSHRSSSHGSSMGLSGFGSSSSSSRSSSSNTSSSSWSKSSGTSGSSWSSGTSSSSW